MKPRIAVLHGLFQMRTSLSVPRIFASFDRALRESFDVETLPANFHARSEAERASCLRGLFERCDAAIVPGVVSRRLLFEVFRALPRESFPFLYVPMGELPRGAPLLRNVFTHLGPRDTLLVSCDADRRIALRLADSCRARARVVPLGVDCDIFRPASSDARASVRRELGLQAGDVAMIYTGRVCAEKNVHGAIALFHELAPRHPELHLIVVGPPRDELFQEFGTRTHHIGARLRRQVSTQPATAARVHFIAKSTPERVASLCGAADLFVNLTLNHDENFGLSAVEAMGCGLAVVGTYWGGQQDTIDDGVTGHHVATWSSETGIRYDAWQAARAAESLIASPALRRRMGRKGRARALALFSMEALAVNLRAAVDESLARRLGDTHNRLSRLGRAFHAAFSRAATADDRPLVRNARIGMIPSYDDDARLALYRSHIAPYTSGEAPVPARDEDVLFLRSPFLRVKRGGIVVCDDPLWPFEAELDDPLTARVLTDLTKERFLSMGTLRARVGTSKAALAKELRELCSLGVLGVSVARAPRVASRPASRDLRAARPSARTQEAPSARGSAHRGEDPGRGRRQVTA